MNSNFLRYFINENQTLILIDDKFYSANNKKVNEIIENHFFPAQTGCGPEKIIFDKNLVRKEFFHGPNLVPLQARNRSTKPGQTQAARLTGSGNPSVAQWRA